MTIPTIVINGGNVPTIRTTQIFMPPSWLTDNPPTAIPIYGPVASPDMIGVPVIDMPGCVEAHEQNSNSIMKNKNLEKDDPDGVVVYCDAGVPSYDAMNYEPEQLTIVREVEPPPVSPPPEPPEAEVPDTGDVAPEEEVLCPGPNQPRVGDLTQKGDERVIGHEIQVVEGRETCVVLYEETTLVEKLLPSTNQVTTTTAIAVVATAAAAATPILLRVVKPIITKVWKTIQKKFGKTEKRLSLSEIKTNKYREKKGLPPVKRKN